MSQTPDFIVAIDGPSGAGKTAAGAMLAQRIGGVLVDTGVFYRALTLLALLRSVPTSDGAALATLAGEISVELTHPEGGPSLAEVRVSGKPVADAIRSDEVEVHVSEVAAHPQVRAALLTVQRAAVSAERAVVLGRDVGTVVFPHAQLKVYLEASAAERARRRALQLGARQAETTVAAGMSRRDALDAGRATAPMEPAPDAIVLDTDQLPLSEVVDRLEQLVQGSVRYVER